MKMHLKVGLVASLMALLASSANAALFATDVIQNGAVTVGGAAAPAANMVWFTWGNFGLTTPGNIDLDTMQAIANTLAVDTSPSVLWVGRRDSVFNGVGNTETIIVPSLVDKTGLDAPGSAIYAFLWNTGLNLSGGIPQVANGSRFGIVPVVTGTVAGVGSQWTVPAIEANSFTVVPEPSTYAAIFGALSLGAGIIARRFRRSAKA